MRTIWKYELKIEDEQTISLPEGALPLKVAEQDGELYAWFMVDPDKRKSRVQVEIYGTGQDIYEWDESNSRWDNLKHIGTALMSGGFVWHVFYTPNI